MKPSSKSSLFSLSANSNSLVNQSIGLILILILLVGCDQSKSDQDSATQINPSWKEYPRVTQSHLRGLHVVNDSVAWSSGTEGTVLRTIDGETWQNISIDSTKNLDFRDIHAFNKNNAVVLSAGNGVSIYRTANGGSSWELVFHESDSNLFFDGMDFSAQGIGYAYGDPRNGKMTLLESIDFGKHWNWISEENSPQLDSNEAGYAASGTGIVVIDEHLWIATGGGKESRVFSRKKDFDKLSACVTPIHSGSGAGIFSMCFWNHNEGIIVGGSYIDSTNASSNCAVTSDGGKSWKLIDSNNPRGYRSCVCDLDSGKILIATGRTGSDYSLDKGSSWKAIGDNGYFSCSAFNQTVWAVGRNGKMAKLILNN